MTSPDQIAHLQDQDDLYSAILMAGCLLFFVGGVLAIFAVQDFASGTNFMQRLAGAEQVLGVLLIVVGWFKVHTIKKELERSASPHEGKATAARAGE